ncbi:hypothetical protein GCM10011409_22970 [Lentibacillus populi]|uniref:Uncharacterized protein n=1 Tax=Lentibacillus populi TaxID=1827502 RepID=A0A9W5TYD4_9BACI|nr:hypothetical protein [Lentibacillus populi]GGB44770.1 hypothetical protein GCM10011409_22970 [Lentibacillus populi]
MKNINTPEELYEELDKLSKEHSVSHFYVPGKGTFTLAYEEREKTVQEEMEEDDELREMINESRKEYREGKYRTTDEIIESLYKEDSNE